VISGAMDKVNDPPRRLDTGAARPTGDLSPAVERVAAPSRPAVATAPSKAAALTDWAADVVKAAGVEITTERVEEHANMIASVTRRYVFLPLGRVDSMKELCPNGEMPDGTAIETFDELYRYVIARVGDPRTVDRSIDECLAASWDGYVRGCCATYS